MQYIRQYGFLILMIILTFMGYLKLKNSVSDGMDGADAYLRSMGGSMDSEQFNVIQNTFALSDVVLGCLLFAVGLSFLCFSIYKLLKKDN